MIFIRKYKNRNRPGATRISAKEDIAKLLSHDWSDPLLDEHFAMVVEKLTRISHPDSRENEEDEEDDFDPSDHQAKKQAPAR